MFAVILDFPVPRRTRPKAVLMLATAIGLSGCFDAPAAPGDTSAETGGVGGPTATAATATTSSGHEASTSGTCPSPCDSNTSDCQCPSGTSGTTGSMYPSSCADILDAGASLGDGVYTIAPSSDASPYQVFCNMTLAGGGWTNFFYGLNGSPYVFAHFEQTAVDCPDPSSQCLRRIPPEVSVSSVLATCGSAAVTFVPGAGVLAYLHNGTQGDWEPNSNVTSVDGNVDTAFASHMYIGKSDGNLGWILSATPDDSHNMIPSTFSNSYNLNSDWDYCNGVATIGEPVTLSYR